MNNETLRPYVQAVVYASLIWTAFLGVFISIIGV